MQAHKTKCAINGKYPKNKRCCSQYAPHLKKQTISYVSIKARKSLIEATRGVTGGVSEKETFPP